MQIVPIVGQVKYSITLDPSSWIFDDRKIAYDDFYDEDFNMDEFLEAQEDERAGAAIPRMAKAVRKYKKEDWLKETFVIPLKLFIENAEPLEGANVVIFERSNGDAVTLPLDHVWEGVFQFSKDGKLLTEEGPIIYLDKNQSEEPVTRIAKISIA